VGFAIAFGVSTVTRRGQRVLLAPELAPGNVDELDGGPWTGPALGAGVASVPDVLPAPGVAVLGVVPGVAVAGGVSGGGATTVGLELVALGGGGPASGRFGAGAGGIFVLVGSPSGPLLVVPPGIWFCCDGFGGAKLGVPSLALGASAPNGLRWSIELCASSGPVQVGCASGCSAALRSATLTSAGGVRSAAPASFTTTGCKNSMSASFAKNPPSNQS